MEDLSNSRMSSGSAPRRAVSPDLGTCAICDDPLAVIGETQAVVDDVELCCGHHFHWSCILDSITPNTGTRGQCPSCNKIATDYNGRLLVTVRNEGGVTEGFDLGAEIDEQAFLDANPAERRKDLFLALMSQGDHDEAEVLLRGEDTGANGEKMDPNVTYEQGEMTAMHMAALANDVVGIELLLRYGADRKLKTLSGHTALELAQAEEAWDAVALLSSR